MSKRAKTQSFVAEFPLATPRSTEGPLDKRFRAGCHVYNGVLAEGLNRVDLLRDSKAWQAARRMPEGEPDSPERKARAKGFRAAAMAVGFTAYQLRDFAVDYRKGCWANDHLGSHDTQALGFRAFRSLEQYLYGTRGRPRFKRGEQFTSMEGFSNEAVIRYRDGVVHWAGLAMPILRDARDKDRWEQDALACPTKYVRIVRRRLKGRWRYYAQLVQLGKVPTRGIVAAKGGVGGLDLGPSTLAAVTDNMALKTVFCPKTADKSKEVRLVQRRLDRSRRATNPGNYHKDGTVQRGPKKWVKSAHYRQAQSELADLQAALAATRKREHGELANRLMAQARDWRTEDVSYQAYQQLFGRSVGKRAPSQFIATLTRKAENAGGKVVAFSTRTTRLSQFDHSTGTYVKKPLSQRLHVFGDGRIAAVDRDLYSAFLARFVRKNQLDTRQVVSAWPSAEPLVRLPVSSLPNYERRASPSTGGRKAAVRVVRQSKVRSSEGNSGDAVGRKAESPGKTSAWIRKAARKGRAPTRIP